MGTLHLVVSVFALIWKTPRPLKLRKTISLSRGRTLSGHTWSTARKFLILNLNSLHPSGKPHLGKLMLGRTIKLVGYGPQLLSDSLWWSNHEFDCSALFTPARTSPRRCCTADTRCSGTSCGGMTPDTHSKLHGLHSQGQSSPQDEALQSTTLLDDGSHCSATVHSCSAMVHTARRRFIVAR